MALDDGQIDSLFPELVSEYRHWYAQVAPKFYLDKSHPNLWLADRLVAAFPDCSFLGIERSPLATVSSMLQHDGVRRWCETWRDFPLPNRFLGITTDNLDAYAEMSVTQRCALRWRAHNDELQALGDRLGPRLLTVRYEDLEHEPKATVARLTRFLDLSQPIPLPQPPAGPPEKWRSLLSAEQIDEIQTIVGPSSSSGQYGLGRES